MADLMQQVDINQKRASLLSNHRYSELRDGPGRDNPPADKFHFLHLAFFLLGVGSMVPMSFFLSANDYWTYKFRDVGQPINTSVKNTLQKNFQSTSSVIGSVSSIITNVIASLFAHKLTLRRRFIGTMFSTTLLFIFHTILVKVDTDSWQLGFFILEMVLYFFNNIAGSLFMMTNMAMISRFPPIYMKSNMYGSSLGMMLGAIVQIVCLWIGGTSTQVALIYFLTGTFICLLTLTATCYVHYIPRFIHYQGDVEADTKKPLPTWQNLKEVSKNIWPLLLTNFIGCLTMPMSGSAVTSLIHSEYNADGDPWTSKYFVPVSAFLLPGICGTVTKVFGSPILNKSNVYWWMAISLCHSLIVSPLMLFCRTPEPKHLPLLFGHDWQFITLQVVNSSVGNYLGSLSFLSMPNFAGDKTELTFLVMATLMGIFIQVTSPLTSVWVNIL